MNVVKTWSLSVSDLAGAVGGEIEGHGEMTFSRVGTDTRQNLKGRLFVPLRGENFDGHDFVAPAIDAGAAAVLVHEWRSEWDLLTTRVPFVRVADTLQALQALARFWRRRRGFFVLGITGSNGKTSTKEFTHALLKDHYPTFSAKGSFNNHWGVPLTILEAGPEHTHLIVEMGMNHAGEIRQLGLIAEPDVVVVTTVGRAHIGELGSQDAVAAAKEEIYTTCPRALHVFNLDNEWTMRMQARSQARQILFSAFRPSADVHLRAQRMNWDGLDVVGQIGGEKNQIWVHVLGRHNLTNLMAAAGLALATGLRPGQIWSGLERIRDAAWGRNQVVSLLNGARVLFDAYNANPDSMQALLKNIFEMDVPGKKYLVVGDMKELGSFTDEAHEEIGEKAGHVGFEKIWYIGRNGAAFVRGLEKSGKHFICTHSPDVDPRAADQFGALLRDGDLVAVKGSRGMALERVVERWSLAEPLGKKP
jgi:UDP-N-acetylmuramoyl-tripeptide--D-alanyl-D-alanine ligase